MRKKITILSLLFALILCFAACGASAGSDTDDAVMAMSLEQSSQSLIMTLEDTDDAQLQQMLAYYAGNAESDNTAALNEMLLADYIEVRPELGEFEGFGDFDFERSGKTLTATQTVHYTKRNIELVYVIDAVTEDISAININRVYTRGEIMKTAGLNTLMGIGTVFVILVLLSLLIYAFRVIPMIEEKIKGEPEPQKVPFEDELKAPTPVDETDNNELIAVIAAAIAASTGQSTDDFVVRSIIRR